MTTLYCGWTPQVSDEEKAANRARAQAEIDNDRIAAETRKALGITEPLCSCFEIMGDNPDCPIHGTKAKEKK